MSLIIFSGIEGIFSTAFTEQDYRSIKRAVEKLHQHHVSLVLVTNQTRAEVTDLASKIALDAPLIVEHGSGIFIPEQRSDFELEAVEKLDGYYLHQLGCNYTEARAALKAVQEEINKILRGFGDLDEADIQPLVGGSITKARQAKAREFSEYFFTPNRVPIAQLQEVATDYGFKIAPGEKLSLMMGGGADPALAVQWIVDHYQPNSDRNVTTNTTTNVTTVGLGSSVQDTIWLETVQQPMIIPNEVDQGSIQHQHWQTAKEPGLTGWLNSIEELIGKLQG